MTSAAMKAKKKPTGDTTVRKPIHPFGKAKRLQQVAQGLQRAHLGKGLDQPSKVLTPSIEQAGVSKVISGVRQEASAIAQSLLSAELEQVVLVGPRVIVDATQSHPKFERTRDGSKGQAKSGSNGKYTRTSGHLGRQEEDT